MFYLPHKACLLELKVTFLSRVHVVQNHEPPRWFILGKLAEVDALHGESNLGAVSVVGVQVGPADGQVLVELRVVYEFASRIKTVAAQAEDLRLLLHALDVFDFDGEVEFVVLHFQRLEQRVNVLRLTSLELAMRVLDVEHPVVVVLLVQALKRPQVDLVL